MLRSLKIPHFLAKIFKDLLLPCQDPERSWQENLEDRKDLGKKIKELGRKILKIRKDLGKKIKDLGKKIKDP